MRLRGLIIAALAAAVAAAGAAHADYLIKDGNLNIQTVFAFVCQTTKICPAMILADSNGVEKGTPTNPVRVDPVGTTTQPVSAATLPLPSGASSAANQTAVQGSATGGAAATASQLAGGVFNVGPPSLSDGQQAAVQMDSGGNVKVNCVTGCTGGGGSSSITDWGGGTLGAMASYGTSPGAVLVPGVNAFVTNTPSVAQSGTWTVQPGNTANTTPWLASISQGGNTAVVKAGNTAASGDEALVVADSNLLAAVNGPIPAGTNLIGKTTPNDGTNSQLFDPCQTVAKQKALIDISTATTTKVITGASSKKTYICKMTMQAWGSQNVRMVEATTTSTPCDGTQTAVFGGTTTGHGYTFVANGGITEGNGSATVEQAVAANANDVCIITTAAVQLSGSILYVQR